MYPAKKFFYVCAWLFLLTLSWQLGARSASAQGGATVQGAAIEKWDTSVNTFIASAVVGREFHVMNPDGSIYTYPTPIPGTAAVVATYPSRGVVILENGDILWFRGSDWTTVGNLVGSAVNVERHSLGQLKARFRGQPSTGR